jgi:glutamate-1-semialdehyde 2,1-aminomutase
MSASLATIDRDRLSALIDRERAAYRASFPASRQAFAAAGTHLLGGVPMTWMRMWSGGFPLYCATASGARLTDIDGHEFIDCCPRRTRRGSQPSSPGVSAWSAGASR